MADSESASLGWGSRVHISNSCPGDAGTAGPDTTLNCKGRERRAMLLIKAITFYFSGLTFPP